MMSTPTTIAAIPAQLGMATSFSVCAVALTDPTCSTVSSDVYENPL
ncbi:Uncharacterised protein [Bordetella pertussis]|nr:Uncharacterised protein [Bordetella pertussis]